MSSPEERTKELAGQAFTVLINLIHIQVEYTTHEFDLYNLINLISSDFLNNTLNEQKNRIIELVKQDTSNVKKFKHMVQTSQINIDSLQEVIDNNKQIVIEMNELFIEFSESLHEINFFGKEDDEELIILLNKYKKSTSDIFKFTENEEFKTIAKDIHDNIEYDKSHYSNIMVTLINGIPYVYIFEVLKILKLIANS
jgi:hypothetical protein